MPYSSLHGRAAALSRRCAADDPRLIDARRDLAAFRIEEYVGRIAAAAPPLTGEQRRRITALLDRPAGRHA